VNRLRRFFLGEHPSERLATRNNLSLREIYNHYEYAKTYPELEWVEAWTTIARILKLQPGVMRGSDRFDKELLFVDGLFRKDSAAETLMDWVMFGTECDCDPPFDSIETVDGLLEYLLRRPA